MESTNQNKQTAVEFFVDRLKKLDIEINAIQLAKLNDAYEKAKEMEEEQRGYSEEDMESAWNSSEQNMRFQFSSSVYKNVKFEKWLEIYKKEIKL